MSLIARLRACLEQQCWLQPGGHPSADVGRPSGGFADEFRTPHSPGTGAAPHRWCILTPALRSSGPKLYVSKRGPGHQSGPDCVPGAAGPTNKAHESGLKSTGMVQVATDSWGHQRPASLLRRLPSAALEPPCRIRSPLTLVWCRHTGSSRAGVSHPSDRPPKVAVYVTGSSTIERKEETPHPFTPPPISV